MKKSTKVVLWIVGILVALFLVRVVFFGSKTPSRPAGQLGSQSEAGHYVQPGGDNKGGGAKNASAPQPVVQFEKAELEDGVVATLDRFGQSVVVKFGEDGRTGWVRHVTDSEATAYGLVDGVAQATLENEHRSGYAGLYARWKLVQGGTLREMVVELTRLGNRRKEVAR